MTLRPQYLGGAEVDSRSDRVGGDHDHADTRTPPRTVLIMVVSLRFSYGQYL